jgi:hypothetical protein
MDETIEKPEELQQQVETDPSQTSQNPLTHPQKKPRQSTGRRRRNTSFKMPKHVAVPVKGLWEAAGEEEKQKAHQAGGAILEMWLGQASRKEVATRLEVPALRVWQLSQQALSGLLAGLLKQPRSRGQIEKPAWQQAKLEKEVDSLRSLVELLRDFPIHRETAREKEVDRTRSSATKSRHPQCTPKRNRKKTAGKKRGKKRTRSRGSSPRSDGADREKLDEERRKAAEAPGAPSARSSGPLSSGEGGSSPAKTSGRDGGLEADREGA